MAMIMSLHQSHQNILHLDHPLAGAEPNNYLVEVGEVEEEVEEEVVVVVGVPEVDSSTHQYLQEGKKSG